MGKFIIDYGHCDAPGSADTGARISHNGVMYNEEGLTRDIGRRVTEYLRKQGHTVLETGVDFANSVSESLNLRVNAINKHTDYVPVSIHINAGGGTGTEIYTKGGKKFTEVEAILKNFEKLGYRSRGVKNGSEFALVGRPHHSAAMLVECFFIDNYEDIKRADVQNIALAIANGLLNGAIGGSATPTPPAPPTNNNSNDENRVIREYAETGYGIPRCAMNVRNAPSTNSPAVATYSAGEKINSYDKVVETNRYYWLSYISYGGTRRYIATFDKKTGERFVDCY
ncbi:MAG: N-acetylmuramoyl-L-alanine amidase [Anaerotignaceae bacterium]